jgi:hypothetical protein
MEVITSNPEVAARFGTGMQALNYIPGQAIGDIPTAYDWASLGNATIVNGMGSRGEAAFELAKTFPDLKFIVQDSKNTLVGVDSTIPSELAARVTFQEHELFAPQEARADVYFFRMLFRNLGDAAATMALKAQIPALQSGTKILIQDVVMPEPKAIPLWKDRVARYVSTCRKITRDMERLLTAPHRSVDVALQCFFNGRERYLDEWEALLASADERFVLHRVVVPKDSLLGIIEVHWNT